MRQDRKIGRRASVSLRHLSAGERVADYLRRLHPEKTGANVAADTRGRLSAKTVDKMLERQSAPSLPNAVILLEAYGPSFMCALMGDRAPDWLSEAGRAARRAELEAKIAALNAELEEVPA